MNYSRIILFRLVFLSILCFPLLGTSQMIDIDKYGQLNLKIAHETFTVNSVEKSRSYKLTEILTQEGEYMTDKIVLNYTGQAMLEDSVMYEKHPEEGWKKKSTSSFSYNANGNITTKVKVSDGDTLERTVYEYNGDGKIVERRFYFFGEKRFKWSYSYEDGKRVGLQKEHYDIESSEWVTDDVKQFQYKNGKLSTILVGFEPASIKYDVTYFEEGKLESFSKFRKYDNNWVKEYKRSFSFGENGQLQHLIYYGVENNEWYENGRLTVEYNAEDRVVKKLREFKRKDSGSWSKNDRLLFTYDDRSLKKTELKQVFDTEQNKWVEQHENEYFYKDEEKLTSLNDYSGENPIGYHLEQNHPNPFNPTTTIKFTIPSTQHVTLAVYNSIGQRIDILVNKVKQEGVHSVRFNASPYASGLYLYRLETKQKTLSKRMTILK